MQNEPLGGAQSPESREETSLLCFREMIPHLKLETQGGWSERQTEQRHANRDPKNERVQITKPEKVSIVSHCSEYN